MPTAKKKAGQRPAFSGRSGLLLLFFLGLGGRCGRCRLGCGCCSRRGGWCGFCGGCRSGGRCRSGSGSWSRRRGFFFLAASNQCDRQDCTNEECFVHRVSLDIEGIFNRQARTGNDRAEILPKYRFKSRGQSAFLFVRLFRGHALQTQYCSTDCRGGQLPQVLETSH